MIWQVESRKDPHREEWHLYLYDGSGKPEGRSYLCSALTETGASIIRFQCSGVEADDADLAYRAMIQRLDQLGFESVAVAVDC